MPLTIQGKHAIAAGLASGLSLTALLFTNNHTPGEGDTLADYTEATFTGYAQIALSGASATGARVTWSGLTWTYTGLGTGQTIYGVCVFNGSGTLIWAKKFASPVTVSAGAPNVNYTPTFTL
jgi:hypothetical protein